MTRAAAVMSRVELGSAGADEGPAVLCESVQDIVQVECVLSDHLQGLAGGSGRRWPERLQRLGPGPARRWRPRAAAASPRPGPGSWRPVGQGGCRGAVMSCQPAADDTHNGSRGVVEGGTLGPRT